MSTVGPDGASSTGVCAGCGVVHANKIIDVDIRNIAFNLLLRRSEMISLICLSPQIQTVYRKMDKNPLSTAISRDIFPGFLAL